MSKRNQEPKEIVKVGGESEPAPDWLAEYQVEDDSLESLKEYVVLPYLKIIQSTTDADLKKEYGEASVVVLNANIKIADSEEPFLYVPVFHFTEFCKWRDYKDKETPNIVERTFDPTAEIAKLARNEKKRKEEYVETKDIEDNQKKKFWKYVEHINFVGLIYSGSYKGLPVVISFSRGEFFTGQNYASTVRQRGIPMWSQVWELRTKHRSRGGFSWYGFHITPPSEGALTTIVREEAPAFKEKKLEFQEHHQNKRLVVDLEGDQEPDATEALLDEARM